MSTNPATFSDMALDPQVHDAVERQGFTVPTAVQANAIPPALEGRDILASAQTGSGKTLAFVLPLINRLVLQPAGRPQPRKPRMLILAPTRELASQIDSVVSDITSNLRLSHTVIFGGVNKNRQIQTLQRGVDIAVATPGRLLDLASDRAIDLGSVEILVLDEADRMLDMGFIPDVRRVIKLVPSQRQSLFFSATMPDQVAALAQDMLANPVRVSVESEKAEAPDINQQVLFVTRENKRDALRMLLTDMPSFRAIVFTRTKFRARDVAKHLNKHGITADDLHGNKSQSARERALRAFHSGKIHVLVATDIASRGIDVDEIDQVINFELPNEPESYVHRIGRTARAGKSGAAFSLCEASEVPHLIAIEKQIASTVDVFTTHEWHDPSIARSAEAGRQPRQGGRSRGGDSRGNSPRNNSSRRSGSDGGRGQQSRRRRPRQARASA